MWFNIHGKGFYLYNREWSIYAYSMLPSTLFNLLKYLREEGKI